jgi:hypothetical protein
MPKVASVNGVLTLATCVSAACCLRTADRQAEWNTLVLQREQAALKALQESQVPTGLLCSADQQQPCQPSQQILIHHAILTV